MSSRQSAITLGGPQDLWKNVQTPHLGTGNAQHLGNPCINATKSDLRLYLGVSPEVCNPQTLSLHSHSFPRNSCPLTAP